MKIAIIALICSFWFLSCDEIGEGSKDLEIEAFANKVYNAGTGISVQDPGTRNTDARITLTNGFFEFSFRMTNGNAKPIVLTDFTVELFKSGSLISSKDFVPQAYVANTEDEGGVGDDNQRFFAHLNPEAEVKRQVGGFQHGKFYIDSLERDENGLFLHEVRVTFNGFLTDAVYGSEDDPFADDDGPVERIIVFSVK